MDLRRRLLRMLEPAGGGERKLSVLEGIAGSKEALWRELRPMLRGGVVISRRCNGGMRIGLPGVRRGRSA